jgi:hypothetical protein
VGLRRDSLLALLDGAQGLARPTPPFTDYDRSPDVVWLAPKLVAEVTYAELMQGQQSSRRATSHTSKQRVWNR